MKGKCERVAETYYWAPADKKNKKKKKKWGKKQLVDVQFCTKAKALCRRKRYDGDFPLKNSSVRRHNEGWGLVEAMTPIRTFLVFCV